MQVDSHELKLRFSSVLQNLEGEIYQELYPRLFHPEFDESSLLTKEACKNLSPDGKKLVLKIHEMILSRFQQLGMEKKTALLLDQNRLLIPERIMELFEKKSIE